MGPVSYLKRSLFKLEPISLGIFWPKVDIFHIFQFGNFPMEDHIVEPVSSVQFLISKNVTGAVCEKLWPRNSSFLFHFEFYFLTNSNTGSIASKAKKYWMLMHDVKVLFQQKYLEKAFRKHLAFFGNCSSICMLRNSYMRT